MLSELRFALRQLAKAPGFTATIIVTLALGIGACTAIYSAIDSIVLRPFDDPDAARNVTLQSSTQSRLSGLSFPDFLDYEQQAQSFEFMAHYSPGGYVTCTGLGEPMQLRRIAVTQRYFDMLGVKMALGRAFLPDEFISGNHQVLVLGYGFWRRAFGGSKKDAIGRVLPINGQPYTVIGIAPERFERVNNFIDVWLPFPPPVDDRRDPRGVRTVTVSVARLRRGVTLTQAQAELSVIAGELAGKYPDTNKGYGVVATQGSEYAGMSSLRPTIKVLFSAVGCLLLIVCANVGNLLLVRATARQREISVRAALGATRMRLLRQLLVESLVLAVLGGIVGILVSHWAVDFIRSSVPTGRMARAGVNFDLFRIAYLKLDGTVLLFAVALSLATVLLFGLAPAWLACRADLNGGLKQGARGSTEGRTRQRFRAALIASEVALAVTVLACAGLFIQSFLRLARCDVGFDPSQSAFARVQLAGQKYDKPEQQIAFNDALLTRLSGAPGVEVVGATSFFPLSGAYGAADGFEREGAPPTTLAERPIANSISVTPDYFRAMRVRLADGRFFTERDTATAPRVALINRTLARQYFPNENPIGKRITIANGSDAWREIVGVVEDVAQAYVGEVPPNQVYEPFAQRPTKTQIVVVRTAASPDSAMPLFEKNIHAVDPEQPITDLSTTEAFVMSRFVSQRLGLQLLTGIAVIALLIAAVGIYGVVAFSVSQRTVEIGIRMALGASENDVLRQVLRSGMSVVALGIGAGLVTTLACGQLAQALLFNTTSRDPVVLVGIVAIIGAVAFLACWLPARRATKVDPIVALRAE